MNIEVTACAPDYASAVAFMKAVGILDENENPSVFIHVDNIGPIGTVPDWHVNVIYYGATAEALTEGLAQFDADGRLLDLFVRTRILDYVAARTGAEMAWAQDRAPIPPGYELNGIRLYDPSLISSRSRVWA